MQADAGAAKIAIAASQPTTPPVSQAARSNRQILTRVSGGIRGPRWIWPVSEDGAASYNPAVATFLTDPDLRRSLAPSRRRLFQPDRGDNARRDPWRRVACRVASLVVASALCAGCAPASSRTADQRFGGQTVRLIVGFPTGGGHDLHARVLARRFSRHLPGQPAVVVENMTGAGGLIAANYLAAQAPRDGTAIGLIAGSMVLSQLVGDAGVRYDVRAFAAIGAPTFETIDVCFAGANTELALDSWRESTEPPRFGISVYGSRGHAGAVLMTSALGLPVRMVPGYGGTAELALAIDRGEVDGSCMGWGSYQALLAPSGRYAVVLLSRGDPSPELAGVPSAARQVTDERGRTLVSVLGSIGMLDRYLALPPGTPTDIVASLRAAFEATVRDEAFLGDAETTRLEIRPVSGAEIEQHVSSLFNLRADIQRDVTTLLTEQAQ